MSFTIIILFIIIIALGLGIFCGLALTKGPGEKSEKDDKNKKD